MARDWYAIAMACCCFYVMGYPSWSYAGCADPSHADTNVSYAKMRPPKYPSEAAAAHVEGRVLLNVTVEKDGTPSDIVVQTSSGNASLDNAAVEAVSSWKFSPSLCGGKAIRSIAQVPVDFQLSDALPPESIEMATAAKPSDAGVPVLSEVGRELAPDQRPMEFQSVSRMLQFLRNDVDVKPIGAAHSINLTTTLSMFESPASHQTWKVWESTEGGWTVTRGGWASIIRTRFTESGRTTWELYSQLCNGDTGWCSRVLNFYLSVMKQKSPPIPPPAPTPKASVGP